MIPGIGNGDFSHLKVQRGARGVELITINGVQMTVSEAARQGLL